MQVTVTDTAGLRETLDPVEAEGVAVAQEIAQQADLVLSVFDSTSFPFDLTANSGSAETTLTGLAAKPGPTGPTATKLAAAPGPAGASLADLGANPGSSRRRQPFSVAASNAITVLNKADMLSPDQSQQLQAFLQSQLSHQSSLAPNAAEQPAPIFASVQHTQVASDQHRQAASDKNQPESMDPQAYTQAVTELATNRPTEEFNQAKVVLCSCMTTWNMDVLLQTLEQSVQNLMASGQNAQAGLVITRQV